MKFIMVEMERARWDIRLDMEEKTYRTSRNEIIKGQRKDLGTGHIRHDSRWAQLQESIVHYSLPLLLQGGILGRGKKVSFNLYLVFLLCSVMDNPDHSHHFIPETDRDLVHQRHLIISLRSL
jgi:hypothetical protein